MAHAPFQPVLHWLRHAKFSKSCLGVQLVLATVERLLFDKASLLREGEDTRLGIDLGGASEASSLNELVTAYCSLVDRWLSCTHSQLVMSSAQRSQQLVAVWCACCLMHKFAVSRHPLLDQFAMPLDWRHMSVAVLADKHARDALQQVVAYVRRAG